MDGGGRLLRSLGTVFGVLFARSPLAPAAFAFSGTPDPFALSDRTRAAPRLPFRLWRQNRTLRFALARFASNRFVGTYLALGLLAAAGAGGLVQGGFYAELIASQGTIPDIAARMAGFPIKAITITGAHELTEAEVLALAEVGPRNSLAFLDVAKVRSRLKAVPLIHEASVSKLYPDRLLIELEERQPSALWQKDGAVSIVAGDGTPIDIAKDPRFAGLPLVVGDKANERLGEYLAVLEAAGELHDRIRAGLYVAGRRWTLKMSNDVEVALPDKNPAEAIARLAAIEHDGHILEKDVISIDMRIPGRVVARLTAEAAAIHAAAAAAKAKKKSAAT